MESAEYTKQEQAQFSILNKKRKRKRKSKYSKRKTLVHFKFQVVWPQKVEKQMGAKTYVYCTFRTCLPDVHHPITTITQVSAQISIAFDVKNEPDSLGSASGIRQRVSHHPLLLVLVESVCSTSNSSNRKMCSCSSELKSNKSKSKSTGK